MYFKPEWYRLTAGEVIAFVIRRRVYRTTTTLLLSRLYSDIIMNSCVNETNCSVQLSVFCVFKKYILLFIFMNSLHSLLQRWNPAYQTSASDVTNLGIWRTKPRHLTYQTSASYVPNLGIWRYKHWHLTYQTSASDVPNLGIWRTKPRHLEYRSIYLRPWGNTRKVSNHAFTVTTNFAWYRGLSCLHECISIVSSLNSLELT